MADREENRDRRELDLEAQERNYRARGPSPNETDREVLAQPPSDWVEPGEGAADIDPEEAREGMDLLGREGVRDDAIPGVSGLSGMDDRRLGPDRDAHRRNPPQLDDVNNMRGDVSESGGVAGGERGSAGRADDGAGDPNAESRTGPAEYKASSRMDLGHPGTDVGEK